MNRKERRRQQKVPTGAGRSGDAARQPVSVSELLMRHAGLPALDSRTVKLDPDAWRSADGAVSAAFAAWKSERELDERIGELQRAIAAAPGAINLHLKLGDLQIQRRRYDAALETYRRCQAIDPSRRELDHIIAALAGGAPPARASTEYVANLFDGFAERFEETLVHWLDYRGPEIACAAARRALGDAGHGLDILDLGCGTGLNAPLFRPMARRLDGVDISAGMLRQARARKLYDELTRADLQAHLHGTQHRYDLLLAVDVLIYFGDLSEIMTGAARVLRPGGLFVGTVEHAEGADYRLMKTARYTHSQGYLGRLAALAGFEIRELSPASVRNESRQPVPGLCFVFSRPAEPACD